MPSRRRRSNPWLLAPCLHPPASDAGDSSPICILPRSPAPGQARRSGTPPDTSSGVNAWPGRRSPSSSGVYSSLGADLVGSVARHGGCNRRARRCSGSLGRLGVPVFRSTRRHPLLHTSARLQVHFVTHRTPCFPGVSVSCSSATCRPGSLRTGGSPDPAPHAANPLLDPFSRILISPMACLAIH
ncbi:unnamed protein product [Urochloa humidicola]